MILGHEIAGTVARVGAEVASVKPGQRVAVNPSRPCGACRYCQEGKQNHCLDMRFYGSAMRFPHVQGGFREVLVCDEAQAVPVPPAMSAAQAAFAEPFAVCLHAVNRAGPLLGKRVLVTGAGPIGALTVIAARRAGALEIVATDVADAPLAAPRKVGADATVNVSEKDALARYGADKGYFDVMFEASGNAAALAGGLRRGAPDRRRGADRHRRRRDDPADERRGRQGDRAARHVPLPRGVRARGRADRRRAGRRDAAADRDDAARARRTRHSRSRPTVRAR